MASQDNKPRADSKRPLEAEDEASNKERKLNAPDAEPNLNSMVFGLPKYMDQKKFNKLLASHSIVCKKAKKTSKITYAFMYFENMEQKKEAESKLKGVEIKGVKLSMSDMTGNKVGQKQARQKVYLTADEKTNTTPDVNQVTAPLWRIPYAEQLEQKAEIAKSICVKIVKQIKRDSPTSVPHWAIREGDSFPFEGVRSVPITNKYRNKVQFTIDKDANGVPCIGFVAGKFIEGSRVISPEGCVIMPDAAMNVRNAFQEFIASSPLPPYQQRDHVGFWRLLTIKAFRTKEVMAIVQVSPVGTAEKDYDQEKKRFIKFIQDKKDSGLEITSVMIQEYSGVSSSSPGNVPCLPLWGESYVHEKLLGQSFRVSPNAFFQVNTMGAEILYKIAINWCSASPDATVLDLCCGTGTIGQLIANNVKEVLGIELEEDAVADAKYNAKLNDHKNTRYIAGKVEDVLANSFSTLTTSGPIIAIVDPPRAGLHSTVLNAIRENMAITRLVYVSCEPNSLVNDASALCRESKRRKGTPFKPINSVAVDMFPHTKKLEMVILFERDDFYFPVPQPEVTKLEEKEDSEAEEKGEEIDEKEDE